MILISMLRRSLITQIKITGETFFCAKKLILLRTYENYIVTNCGFKKRFKAVEKSMGNKTNYNTFRTMLQD